ncbi:MAG: hypothetical protein JKY51_00765 [Opitutaceae bacterium]|nr:hypothetical protein [Opitutaceae bacterium]
MHTTNSEQSDIDLLILPEFKDDELVAPTVAAKAIDSSSGTLAVWRCTGRYPLRYFKIGDSVKYRVGDLRKFVRSGAR